MSRVLLSFSALSTACLAACTAALACAATPSTDLEAKLADPGRSEADRARDAGRKPAEVVAFLGIEPGMTVMDLIAAGGYYTEVLSLAVGPEGRVYAQNTAFALEIRDGANDKALSARLAQDRLPNVERVDAEIAALPVPDDSIDAAITALNFHDIYNGAGPEAAAAFLAVVHAKLRPGGVLGIVDHVGAPGQDNAALHRMERRQILEVIEASPFVLEAESDALANDADDHTRNVFAPEIRGSTDRFVFRLRKPEA